MRTFTPTSRVSQLTLLLLFSTASSPSPERRRLGPLQISTAALQLLMAQVVKGMPRCPLELDQASLGLFLGGQVIADFNHSQGS